MRAKQQLKITMVVLLALLLLTYEFGNARCLPNHDDYSVDLQALLGFKQGITSDQNGALSNWNTSTQFCRWNSVNCSQARPWRVTGLNLTRKSLSGQISSSLGNLTFLRKLLLRDNNFYGPIPLLNDLQHLEVLNLNQNRLHGIIPDGLGNCSSLMALALSNNNLTGMIPPTIGNLSSLLGLDLSQTNLAGIIPEALGKIATLQIVDLSENQLKGPIPNEFWQL